MQLAGHTSGNRFGRLARNLLHTLVMGAVLTSLLVVLPASHANAGARGATARPSTPTSAISVPTVAPTTSTSSSAATQRRHGDDGAVVPPCYVAGATDDIFSPDPCYSGIDVDSAPAPSAWSSTPTTAGPAGQGRIRNQALPSITTPQNDRGYIYGNYIYEHDFTRPEPGWDPGLLQNTGRRAGRTAKLQERSSTSCTSTAGQPARTTCGRPADRRTSTAASRNAYGTVAPEGLFGPTWIRATATLTVEHLENGKPLSSRQGEVAWIPVAGSSRGRKPLANGRIDDVAVTRPGVCNTVHWTNNAVSQYGNPMELYWEFEVLLPAAPRRSGRRRRRRKPSSSPHPGNRCWRP